MVERLRPYHSLNETQFVQLYRALNLANLTHVTRQIAEENRQWIVSKEILGDMHYHNHDYRKALSVYNEAVLSDEHILIEKIFFSHVRLKDAVKAQETCEENINISIDKYKLVPITWALWLLQIYRNTCNIPAAKELARKISTQSLFDVWEPSLIRRTYCALPYQVRSPQDLRLPSLISSGDEHQHHQPQHKDQKTLSRRPQESDEQSQLYSGTGRSRDDVKSHCYCTATEQRDRVECQSVRKLLGTFLGTVPAVHVQFWSRALSLLFKSDFLKLEHTLTAVQSGAQRGIYKDVVWRTKAEHPRILWKQIRTDLDQRNGVRDSSGHGRRRQRKTTSEHSYLK